MSISHETVTNYKIYYLTQAQYDTLMTSGSITVDGQTIQYDPTAEYRTPDNIPEELSTKYVKPPTGIPKADLSDAVQASLDKADTSLQQHQSLAAYRTAAAQDVIDAGKVNTSDYNPETKTAAMTQVVGKDANGKLWTAPDSVTDVQVNGTSIVQGGVANVPMASAYSAGVVRVLTNWPAFGIGIVSTGTDKGALILVDATDSQIKAGKYYYPILTSNQHKSTFYALAKASGDTTQSASSNPVGTYTESAKSKISEMLTSPVSVSGATPSITALPGVRYVCGEVTTLDITLPASGVVDVTFESGSTATVLTITPPSGVTLKWANGFDPDNLAANTSYEINIMDGLGVAASWT